MRDCDCDTVASASGVVDFWCDGWGIYAKCKFASNFGAATNVGLRSTLAMNAYMKRD